MVASVWATFNCAWVTSNRVVAAFVPSIRKVQALALDPHVLPRVFQPLFRRPQIDVALGDLRQEQDQGVVVVPDRGVQIGVGRFDAAAISSPEVEFPGERPRRSATRRRTDRPVCLAARCC